jgi:hypothetical protein
MTAQVAPLSIEARLRSIQSITDAALSRLDDRERLVELLDRIREILHVDTAAVLLLDFAARQLVATAAVGLEDEVRQGVRIPVGAGVRRADRRRAPAGRPGPGRSRYRAQPHPAGEGHPIHDGLAAGSGQRLTTVVGSAGAGKSVLLADWAAARPAGVTSWLSCDRADTDPVRFWAGFIEELREAVRAALAGQDAPVAGLIAAGRAYVESA